MPIIPACSTAADPISAQAACAGFTQFAGLRVCGQEVFWLASEPATGTVGLWQTSTTGVRRVPTGPGSIRSRLNGYGGGAYAVLPERIVWVSEDQSLWSLNRQTGARTRLLDGQGQAWGGLVADPAHDRVVAVREQHKQQALIAIEASDELKVLHQGLDFYSAPAISDDGAQLAWCSWQLPDMPWLQSMLWVAQVTNDGRLTNITGQAPPAPGSVQQPQYAGEALWVVSDHQGWWQPWQVARETDSYRWHSAGSPASDHANAPWQLGEQHACPIAGGGWARVRYCKGIGELWLDDVAGDRRLAEAFTDFRDLRPRAEQLVCLGRSADRYDSVLQICPRTGAVDVLAGGGLPAHTSARPALPLAFSVPGDQSQAPVIQGFLYLPVSDTRTPPVILMAHGGPTSAAYAVYNPQVQFWCQRGFAVAEVNYTGSTGAGRDFRLALGGEWGSAEVRDMVRSADYLAAQGLVSHDNAFIQGRSSGGYTALMAGVQTRRFCAIGSLFGVTDPMKLRAATHRFESGYLDWLLGDPQSYPDRWNDRTPAIQASRIQSPVIFFQGGLDEVVVPDQTRLMVEALRSHGRRAELCWFDQEGHGFRQANNQAHMLERLSHFYQYCAQSRSSARPKGQ
ncbi:prolyl oligopeptidase family serine peptidase [Marinobacter sp.]|uniref:S9 family peptidase n=1 Tax=Marinobacter sp. TaxID=50741 RepID=UPI0019F2840E|nr:prolyl oligopeptidase family serine peptidase [Marinobacter sp.]MBE0486660.1 S9 family peptidase [Marinobacter sp.]